MRRQGAALASLAIALLVAVATLPQAIGLFGQVYRIEGGGVLAASGSTPPPRPLLVASTVPLTATATSAASPQAGSTIAASATAPLASPVTTPHPQPVIATTSATPRPVTTPASTAAATPTATLRPAATATLRATATSAAVVTPSPSPAPSATPAPCLGPEAVLSFVPAELTLMSTGSGRGRLRLENTGRTGHAREIELQVGLIRGAERLKSLSVNGVSQLAAAKAPVRIAMGGLAPGDAFEIEIAYKADFQGPAAVDTTAPAGAVPAIELRLTVVKEACSPAGNGSGKVSARVLLAPAEDPVATAVPVVTKPIATQPTDLMP